MRHSQITLDYRIVFVEGWCRGWWERVRDGRWSDERGHEETAAAAELEGGRTQASVEHQEQGRIHEGVYVGHVERNLQWDRHSNHVGVIECLKYV